MTSSLEMMYNMGLKNQAAYQMPQQIQADQQMAAAKLSEQQLANDNAATMNPLNAQFKQGEINSQQAQLPGQVGLAQSQAATGQYDTQTLGAKVAAGLSKYADQLGDDGMKQLGRNGEIALQVSQTLAQYPPALHKEVLQKAVQAYGGDPAVFQGILQAPDGDVAKALATMGTGMSMASSSYLQKKAINDADNSSREKIGAGSNAATIESAKIMADSRVSAAKLRAQTLASTLGIDKAIAHYEMQKAQNGGVLSNEDQQALSDLKTQQLQQAAAKGNSVPGQVLGVSTPLQAAYDAGHSGGAPAPAAPVAQPSPAPAPASQPVPVVAPPQAAIDLLKATPSLAPQFDMKYGKGAATRILGR